MASQIAGCDEYHPESTPELAMEKAAISGSSFYQENVLSDKEEAEIVRIRTHLVEKSQGIILWVILVAQELERLVLEEGFSFYELRRKLLVVPSEL